MTSKPIVWIVDEDNTQLDTHHDVLSIVMPGMDVRKILAPPRMSDFLTILDNRDTACLLLDQRLKETGVANYTGIELAQYLNDINSQLPVFILTNYSEWQEFEEDSKEVEDILNKGHVRLPDDDDNLKRIVSKIQRRVNVYLDLRSNQARRTNELIEKSFSGALSEDEAKELALYAVENDKSRYLRELGRIESLSKVVDAHHDLMAKIHKHRSEN